MVILIRNYVQADSKVACSSPILLDRLLCFNNLIYLIIFQQSLFPKKFHHSCLIKSWLAGKKKHKHASHKQSKQIFLTWFGVDGYLQMDVFDAYAVPKHLLLVFLCCGHWINFSVSRLDRNCTFNVHKTFRRRFECLLIFLCMFNLRPVSRMLGRLSNQILINGYRLIRFEQLRTENRRRIQNTVRTEQNIYDETYCKVSLQLDRVLNTPLYMLVFCTENITVL